MSCVIKFFDILCLSCIEWLHNRPGNEIHYVRKALRLICRTREVIQGCAEEPDHCIIIGCIITSYSEYLQYMVQVSDLL